MCGGGLPGSASVTVCPVGSDPRSSEWLNLAQYHITVVIKLWLDLITVKVLNCVIHFKAKIYACQHLLSCTPPPPWLSAVHDFTFVVTYHHTQGEYLIYSIYINRT